VTGTATDWPGTVRSTSGKNFRRFFPGGGHRNRARDFFVFFDGKAGSHSVWPERDNRRLPCGTPENPVIFGVTEKNASE
jgi:hypothetical protein